MGSASHTEWANISSCAARNTEYPQGKKEDEEDERLGIAKALWCPSAAILHSPLEDFQQRE
ncbi:hypothetical protein AAC387_Pa08g1902 [Persea americana]